MSDTVTLKSSPMSNLELALELTRICAQQGTIHTVDEVEEAFQRFRKAVTQSVSTK